MLKFWQLSRVNILFLLQFFWLRSCSHIDSRFSIEGKGSHPGKAHGKHGTRKQRNEKSLRKQEMDIKVTGEVGNICGLETTVSLVW